MTNVNEALNSFFVAGWELDKLLWGILASIGIIVLLQGPRTGPVSWIREKPLRWFFKKIKSEGILDCAKCLGFWIGLVVGVVGGAGPFLCFVIPAVFYLLEVMFPQPK